MSDETAGDDSTVRANDGEDQAGKPAELEPEATTTTDMGWIRASVWGVGVFGYFALLTVWLPSAVLRSGAVASSSSWVQDIVVTGLWSVALAAGLFGLRWAQRRRWI